MVGTNQLLCLLSIPVFNKMRDGNLIKASVSLSANYNAACQREWVGKVTTIPDGIRHPISRKGCANLISELFTANYSGLKPSIFDSEVGLRLLVNYRELKLSE